MPAARAKRAGQFAVHMKHACSPAFLVKVIDVLRHDQHLSGPVLLQPGQGLVGGVGLRVSRTLPPGIVEPLNKGGVAGKSFGCGHILNPVLGP